MGTLALATASTERERGDPGGRKRWPQMGHRSRTVPISHNAPSTTTFPRHRGQVSSFMYMSAFLEGVAVEGELLDRLGRHPGHGWGGFIERPGGVNHKSAGGAKSGMGGVE